jgi:hypothetical protein
MSTERSIEVTIPSVFYWDHVDRDLPAGEIIKSYANGRLFVRLDEDEFNELLSDAEYYAEGGGGLTSEYRGLMASARATVKALKALEEVK